MVTNVDGHGYRLNTSARKKTKSAKKAKPKAEAGPAAGKESS
jgi:hypothetical protein